MKKRVQLSVCLRCWPDALWGVSALPLLLSAHNSENSAQDGSELRGKSFPCPEMSFNILGGVSSPCVDSPFAGGTATDTTAHSSAKGLQVVPYLPWATGSIRQSCCWGREQ